MAKKAIKIKTWAFEQIDFDNGITTLTRTNNGFTILEMLGLAEIAQIELIQQLKSQIPKAKAIRKYVKKEIK